jgi:SAM-dependent methyltransferase
MKNGIVDQSRARTSLAEKLLLALSRDPNGSDYPTTTAEYTLENALDFPRKTVPDFDTLVRDKLVLDYGCGPGWQAVAMRLQCGARRIVGVDINDTWLTAGRELANSNGCSDAVTFLKEVPSDFLGTFDVVVSISSFEHFAEPSKNLEYMAEATKTGGRVIVTFAEPWLSHNGSHMQFFTKVPWVNILFSEKTVMAVRSRFRSDGALRYEEVEGGLNRMTLAKFERIMRQSKMSIESMKFFATKGFPLVPTIPVIREFWVSAATCILRKN